MRDILLSGKDICKTYSNNGVENQVLNKISVDIYKGEFTIIMGPSGSGKSTLMYVLSGMDKPTKGSVYYKKQEISKYNEKQMAPLRSLEFGFIFQQAHLVSNLTLFENIAVAGYSNNKQSVKSVRQRAEMLLQQMQVEKAKDRLPFQVSGGEAQRAAVARAMIKDPGLIFADEPTGALNKKNSDEVLSLLTDLNKNGQSILMVTHDLRAAIRGTRLLYMEDGEIIGEITLPSYTDISAKDRERKVNEWLTSMGW